MIRTKIYIYSSILNLFTISYLFKLSIFSLTFEVIIFPDIQIQNEIAIKSIPYKLHKKDSFMTQIIKTEKYLEWANYTNSYHILCPINATYAQFFFTSVLAREFSTFLHLENAYCSPIKEIASQSHLIRLFKNLQPFESNKKPFLKDGYKNIIFLYSAWGNIFGHFIHDSLAALLKFPKDLIEKSMIMISFDYKVACQYFELFNISKDKILYNKSSWYFAKNLYLHYPFESCFGYMSITFPKLISLLREKTGVNKIIGYRYIFSNRPKHASRHVDNLEEFFNMTKFQFPDYEWEFDHNLNYSNLYDVSHAFATFKLLVAPSGSNTVNMIYMNRNYTTGICLIHSNAADYAIFAHALVSELWANGFCNYWGQHQRGIANNCNIPYGLTCIRRLLYALKFKNWPKSTFNDMKEAFDFPTINALTKKNYKVSRLIEIKNQSYFYPQFSGAYIL